MAQWGEPAPAPAEHRPFSGFAIASLALALLLAGGIGLGVVFGVLALREIGRGEKRGRGVAIAGLVLSGAWTVAIVAVLITGTETDDVPDRAERSPPATTPRTAVQQELPVNLLGVGTCLEDPGTAARNVRSLGTISCTRPHRGEVILGFESERERWPGLAAVRAEAERRCTPTLVSVGRELLRERRVSLVFLYPPEDRWGEDQRRILCIARTERAFRGKLWSD